MTIDTAAFDTFRKGDANGQFGAFGIPMRSFMVSTVRRRRLVATSSPSINEPSKGVCELHEDGSGVLAPTIQSPMNDGIQRQGNSSTTTGWSWASPRRCGVSAEMPATPRRPASRPLCGPAGTGRWHWCPNRRERALSVLLITCGTAMVVGWIGGTIAAGSGYAGGRPKASR